MPPDRLQMVLSRALRRAELAETAKKILKRKTEAEMISEDYAHRLGEKHLYRQLLSDERFDGLRFRWYFTRRVKDTPLDELRRWIDSKIVEEDRRNATANSPHHPLQSSQAPAPTPPVGQTQQSNLQPPEAG